MGSFLEQFNDPGLKIEEGWTPEQEVDRQQNRLARQAAMASHALEVPRRLGDATPAALTADRKLCRRIEARSLQFLRQWATDQEVKPQTHLDDELKAQAAQVAWVQWWADNKTHLQNELRRIATHALRLGHIKAGNSMCNRIINELAQFQQTLDNYA